MLRGGAGTALAQVWSQAGLVPTLLAEDKPLGLTCLAAG